MTNGQRERHRTTADGKDEGAGTMAGNQARLLEVRTRNIRRIELMHVKLEKDQTGGVFFVGQNDQGKSTGIDSIIWALAGGRMPSEMVTTGKDEGDITLDLGTYTVRKRFVRGKAATLSVRSSDGLTGNQKTLDPLCGALGLDPAALARMDGKAQAAAVQQALGLDLSDLEAQEARLFAERTDVTRALRAAREDARQCIVPHDTPAAAVDVSALLDQLDAVRSECQANEASREEQRRMRQAVETADARVRQAEEEVAEAKRMLEVAEGERLAAGTRAVEAVRAAEGLIDPPEAPIRERLANADAMNAAFRKRQERAQLLQTVQEREREAAELTTRLDNVRSAKTERIAATQLPDSLNAIDFDSDKGLTYESFPLAELGTGKGLRVCTNIVLALNSGLPLVLVKAGNDLDDANLAEVCAAATEAGAVALIERITAPADAFAVEFVDGHADNTGGAE